jgi:hypothetical protein
MSEAKVNGMKLSKFWSDKDGHYMYVLKRFTTDYVSWDFGGYPSCSWIRVEDGNREWAKRIAKHYKIKVPS